MVGEINGSLADRLAYYRGEKEHMVFYDSIMQSELLRLRRTGTHDIQFIWDAENNEENKAFINPWTKKQHLDALANDDILHAILESPTGNRPIGYAIIAGLTNPNNNIELMRITLTEKNKGYGREAIRLIKKWAFEKKATHRLWLDVKEHNVRAKHVYKTEGFVEEGTLRDCIRTENGYESLHIMSILRAEFESMRIK